MAYGSNVNMSFLNIIGEEHCSLEQPHASAGNDPTGVYAVSIAADGTATEDEFDTTSVVQAAEKEN